jgi:formate hydrogenlyase subunit 6/NADH:ubiquinone oxidoreductase subunit I
LGRLRGECLNLLLEISGNRLGRGLLRPGGAAFDIPPELARDLRERLLRVRLEFGPVAEEFFSNGTVQARLEGVGTVRGEDAAELGFVGPTARAAGVARDVRADHPWGVFRFAHIPTAAAEGGDAAGRALVRRLEVARSIEFLVEQLDALPRGSAHAECAAALAPSEMAVALVEGWRGEIAHVVVTDDRGGIRRHKVKDPSFHNWTALALAVRGNAVSDFPLCNKSFNLSYAGHNLERPGAGPMLKLLWSRVRRGPATLPFPGGAPALPERFRGRPALDRSRCPDGCRDCAAAAPTPLLPIAAGGATELDLGACLISPDESAACPAGALAHSREFRMATSSREALRTPDGEVELARARSPRPPALRALAPASLRGRR